MDKGRGEIVVGCVAELVIDGETAANVHESAAHLECGTEHLFVVMAGVKVDDGSPLGNSQLFQDRARPGRGVGAIEPHIHVTEMIDLVLGDVARVGHLELRRHRRPVWRHRPPTTPEALRPLSAILLPGEVDRSFSAVSSIASPMSSLGSTRRGSASYI